MKDANQGNKKKSAVLIAAFALFVGLLGAAVGIASYIGIKADQAQANEQSTLDAVFKDYKLIKKPDLQQAVQMFKDYQLVKDSALFGKATTLTDLKQVDSGYLYVFTVDGKQAAMVNVTLDNGQNLWLVVPVSTPSETPTVTP